MDWTGNEGANMRLIRVYTGTCSYQMYCLENDCDSTNGKNSDSSDGLTLVWIIVSIAIGIVCIVGVACLYHKNQQNPRPKDGLTDPEYIGM